MQAVSGLASRPATPGQKPPRRGGSADGRRVCRRLVGREQPDSRAQARRHCLMERGAPPVVENLRQRGGRRGIRFPAAEIAHQRQKNIRILQELLAGEDGLVVVERSQQRHRTAIGTTTGQHRQHRLAIGMEGFRAQPFLTMARQRHSH